MKQLRRFIWHIASRLLIVVVVLGLLITGFYYAMNMTNIYVVLKDGMARRAQVVMTLAEPHELTKFFYNSFLAQDQAVQQARTGNTAYIDYNMVGIDHRLEMGFTWVWPWDERATVTITERIPRIDGRIKGSVAERYIEQYGDQVIYPPDWQSATYKATLVKENGQWKILSLAVMQVHDK